MCVCALAVLACSCPSAFAKADRGAIEGAVVDASGAAVPFSSDDAKVVQNSLDIRDDRGPGLGRDTFYMPRIVDLDFRVTRSVTIREQMRLEFIAEAFNLLIHANILGGNNIQYSRSTSAAVCGIAGAPCLAPNPQFGAPTTIQAGNAEGKRTGKNQGPAEASEADGPRESEIAWRNSR